MVAFGLAGVGSVGLSRESADFIFLKKQIIFLALGIFVMAFFASPSPTRWRFAAKTIYAIILTLLVLVLFFGATVRGTRGWFDIFGFRLQPVEAAKVALIIVLAKFVAEHLHLARQWPLLIRSGALLLPPLALVLLQPDVGSATILIVVWFSIVLAAGVRRRHLFALFGGAAVVATISWFFVLAPYQKERVLTLLNPDRDPLGSGYNVAQSLIAVGSGRFFGRGLGFGAQSQLKFLPEAQTDFIFAVLSEELGFAAVAIMLLAFAAFFYRAIKLARRASDPYEQLVVFGAAAMIFYEMFVNIGMNLGIMPVTGITLPFVSYGGSSLLSHFAILGLILGIASRSAKSAEID